MYKFYWLAICNLCGHRALTEKLRNARIELNRHYFHCHKNVKPSIYDQNVMVMRIRDDNAFKILYTCMVLALKYNRKPPIKISL